MYKNIAQRKRKRYLTWRSSVFNSFLFRTHISLKHNCAVLCASRICYYIFHFGKRNCIRVQCALPLYSPQPPVCNMHNKVLNYYVSHLLQYYILYIPTAVSGDHGKLQTKYFPNNIQTIMINGKCTTGMREQSR